MDSKFIETRLEEQIEILKKYQVKFYDAVEKGNLDKAKLIVLQKEAALAQKNYFFGKFITAHIYNLEADRLKWSLETFPEATPVSSLRKLEEEIKEIEVDINAGIKNPEEYADALMCLLDSAGRHRITLEEIVISFALKFEINKERKWKKNADNSYSHI